MKKIASWSKFLTWSAQEVYYPASLQDLQNIVEHARQTSARIRVGGSLHTLNELIVGREIQILTDHLDKVISLDRDKMLVKVEGGIKLHRLVDYLAQEDLSLPNQGYILQQSVAGAVATATHGSGQTGTLASFVEKIELVTAQGELLTLTPATNLHLFNAVLVNLGCFGIIYSLTVRIKQAKKMLLTRPLMNLQYALHRLPDDLQRYEVYMLMINPYRDQTVLFCASETQEDCRHRGKLFAMWLLRKIIAVISLDIIKRPPNWMIPPVLGVFLSAAAIESCVDFNYRILSPADEGQYTEQEINVPLENLEKALAEVMEIIERYRKQGVVTILPIVLRFCQADSYGYLSPAKDRPSAYISTTSFRKPGANAIFAEIENALFRYGGRPHWGKVNTLTKVKVAELYGENYTRFKQARQELDPTGMFGNSYTDKLL